MKTRNILHHLLCLVALAVLTACGRPDAAIPAQSTDVSETPAIYPDYRDVVIPPNIAPLNFKVKSAGTEFVGCIEAGGKQILTAAADDGKLEWDSLQWRQLLTDNKGKDLKVTLYAHRDGGWVKFPAFTLSVAPEEIDRYLSYRLIEPSYELYRQVGLYQRDLTNFNVSTIYENNRDFDANENHCVNCHNYQNYSTRRMLFHVRAKHGGTVFIDNGKVQKMNLKSDSVLSSCVYPSWHPTRNWVVFSSNLTGQAFHVEGQQKLEVVDYGSDLVFYDADNHTLTNILRTSDDFETFPCWAPDGRKLYYCVAHVPELAGKSNEKRQDEVAQVSARIRYNVMSMTFDPATRRFGPPTLEYDCAADSKSAAVPRISPDGRYLLFTVASYGQFHIWHRDADLFVKDLHTGQTYPLSAANSPEADSYHSWSSNGRWIVFVSRRDDGNYSRPFIAYFDHNGMAHKAFALPQEDPDYSILLNRSYNVPELTRDAVSISAEEISKCVRNTEGEKVTYRKP